MAHFGLGGHGGRDQLFLVPYKLTPGRSHGRCHVLFTSWRKIPAGAVILLLNLPLRIRV